MIRETLYTIGRKKMEAQEVCQHITILLKDTEDYVDGNYDRYYELKFGVDEKGTRYMILALRQDGVGSHHGAYRSGGHWHGAGYNHFIMGYDVKLRKNFKTAEEANTYYYNLKKFDNRTVPDSHDESKKVTEEYLDKIFS